jgi:hypothetical protein
MVRSLADQIREISGSDDELFANLVLQVVHQIKYVPTDYIKYPLVTISDGYGDCDNLATLAAAIMKAGGLDSAVVIGPVVISQGGCFGGRTNHAMLGVHLSEPPDDNPKANPDLDPIDHNLKTYYLAEATRSIGGPPVTDYTGYASEEGSFVGDNPLDLENAVLVVESPDYGCLDPFNTHPCPKLRTYPTPGSIQK